MRAWRGFGRFRAGFERSFERSRNSVPTGMTTPGAAASQAFRTPCRVLRRATSLRDNLTLFIPHQVCPKSATSETPPDSSL
jgi:hypothetical protein